MKHPTEEELIVYHYRDSNDPQAVRDHLETCEVCRASYAGLERLLTTVDATPLPTLDESFKAELWRSLRPLLEDHPRLRGPGLLQRLGLLALPRWALAPVIAAIALAAFFAGHFWPRPPQADPSKLSLQIKASLKAEWQREFDSKLQLALAQVRAETALTVAERLDTASNGPAGILVSRKDFQDLWADFLQTYARNQMENRREIFALRKDLETVVMEAESKLEQTRQQVGNLAALAKPALADPRAVRP
jgi:hypothetical protein